MHSGRTFFSEELRSLPAYPSQIPHQDLTFSQSPGPNRFSGYHSGAEWNLQAPSDADIDDEQHLPAALSRGEVRHNKLLHPPHLQSSPIPIPRPVPTSHPPPQNVSVSPAAMFLAAFSPSMAPAPLPDDEGQVVAGYTLDGIIGYGGSSIIRRAFSASGGVVAVKIVKRSDIQKQPDPDRALRKLEREAEVWSSLSHEHILPLFAAVNTSYADFFVTLFCPAGSMYDILQRDGTPALPQDDAGMMFRQVVRGLRYLHEVAMYVHRDIKLENVLVDEMGVCRIGDFGMSRKIGELDEDDLEPDVEEHHEHDHFHHTGMHRAASIAGPTSRRETRSSLQPPSAIARHSAFRHRNSTSSAPNMHPVQVCQPGSLPYAAPELLLPQTNGPLRPHPAQDIWALGVLLYALLTGCFPFHDSFEPRLQMKILHGTFEFPVGTGRGAERVLKGCLERSTQQRWTISMVDEVAWGIGWGSEGDDVTPAESDEEYEPHCRPSTRPTSRSCSRPPVLVVPIPDNDSPQQEDGRTRPALEAASRRSASRAKRSQSRAPVLTHHHQPYPGHSLSRGVTRHGSRAPSPTPTGSALSASIMSSTESPFLVSPTSSVDRGRRQHRQNSLLLPSRSPSPSVVPGTPVDFGAPFNVTFSASLPVVNDQPDEPDGLRLDRVEEEERRGRSKSTRELRAPPLSFSASDNSDNDNLNAGIGHWGGNLGAAATEATRNEDNKPPYDFSVDSDKERSRSCGFGLRALSPSSRSSRGPPRARHSYHHHHYAHEPYEYDHEFWMTRKGKRTGSQPPTPATPSSTPWSAPPWSTTSQSQSSEPLISAAAINEFLKKLAAPSGDPIEIMMRGRSVDRGIEWS